MSSKCFILFINGEFEFFLHDIADLCLTGSHWLLSGVSVNGGTVNVGLSLFLVFPSFKQVFFGRVSGRIPVQRDSSECSIPNYLAALLYPWNNTVLQIDNL